MKVEEIVELQNVPKKKRDCTEQGVTEYTQLEEEMRVEEIGELQNVPKNTNGTA